MGLMEWFRAGGGGKGASAMTAAFGEIDGVFRPARKEQLTLIEEHKRRRIDDDSADDGQDAVGSVDVDLERGVAVVRIEALGTPAERHQQSQTPPANGG